MRFLFVFLLAWLLCLFIYVLTDDSRVSMNIEVLISDSPNRIMDVNNLSR